MSEKDQLIERLRQGQLTAEDEETLRHWYYSDAEFRKAVDEALANKASEVKLRFHQHRRKHLLQVFSVLVLMITLLVALWLLNPSTMSTTWLIDFNWSEALVLFVAYATFLWFLGRH